jgi:hypothetical protein
LMEEIEAIEQDLDVCCEDVMPTDLLSDPALCPTTG